MPHTSERFQAIAEQHRRCFWLDGEHGHDWSGRTSLMGWLDDDDVSLTFDAASRRVVRHHAGRSEVVGDDIFVALEDEGHGPGTPAPWIGYFGYACRTDLPALVGGGVPDAMWMRPRHVRRIEHPRPVDTALTPDGPEPGREPVPDWYLKAFDGVMAALRRGDSYEVNLTGRYEAVSSLSPVTAYRKLRESNPAPYAAFLQHDVGDARAWLLSSSPERFAVISAAGDVETRPVKGTGPRSSCQATDELLRTALASDPKCRAENLMIVDLLRNDLSMVCETGSVNVPALMQVESYKNLHQLVSVVAGRLRPEISTVEAVRQLFPPGSMTGAPKRRTMEIIRDVENDPRGVYSGVFGHISPDGSADLGVIIRSLSSGGDGRYTFGVGGGITVESDVDGEFEEAMLKAARVLRIFA